MATLLAEVFLSCHFYFLVFSWLSLLNSSGKDSGEETKGAFTIQQKLVQTPQKIGPDPMHLTKKQSSFCGAIGAYGPMKS